MWGADVSSVPEWPLGEEENYFGASLSSLEVAAWAERADLVEILLEFGADPNQGSQKVDPNGPALCLAASSGNVEVVRLLLEYGADPNVGRPMAPDERGHGGIRTDASPLDWAYLWGDTNIIALLIEYGATTNVP